MDRHSLVSAAIAFAGAFAFGTLAEYWAHRLMHQVRWLGKTHRTHHARGTAQGVLLEYAEYLWKLGWLMWPLFLISKPWGFGWLMGINLFAIGSAFAHQLQHENPTKCFWLSMPIHFAHHAHNQWHHNFGVTTNIWDRVFGTYKKVDWRERMRPRQADPRRPIWRLNWLWGGNAHSTDTVTEKGDITDIGAKS